MRRARAQQTPPVQGQNSDRRNDRGGRRLSSGRRRVLRRPRRGGPPPPRLANGGARVRRRNFGGTDPPQARRRPRRPRVFSQEGARGQCVRGPHPSKRTLRRLTAPQRGEVVRVRSRPASYAKSGEKGRRLAEPRKPLRPHVPAPRGTQHLKATVVSTGRGIEPLEATPGCKLMRAARARVLTR